MTSPNHHLNDELPAPEIGLRATITLPGLHLAGEGSNGVAIVDLSSDDDTLVLKVQLDDFGQTFCIFGSRHQLLQFTAELAAVVEIGVLED